MPVIVEKGLFGFRNEQRRDESTLDSRGVAENASPICSLGVDAVRPSHGLHDVPATFCFFPPPPLCPSLVRMPRHTVSGSRISFMSWYPWSRQAPRKSVSVVAQKQVQKKARAIPLIYGLSQRNIAACIAELSTLCMNRSNEVIGAALHEWLYKLPDRDGSASA